MAEISGMKKIAMECNGVQNQNYGFAFALSWLTARAKHLSNETQTGFELVTKVTEPKVDRCAECGV